MTEEHSEQGRRARWTEKASAAPRASAVGPRRTSKSPRPSRAEKPMRAKPSAKRSQAKGVGREATSVAATR